MIDFTPSAEQAAIRSQAAEIASEVLAIAPAIYEKHATQVERFRSTRPLYRQAVVAGLIKRLIPLDHGGMGGTLLDSTILIEELYAVETSVSLTIISTGLGLSPLFFGGSLEQKAEFLEPFLSGQGEPLASLVLSEPTGGANWLEKGAKGLQTVAWEDKRTGEWVLSGEKVWATSSSGWDDRGADIQCVVCRRVESIGSMDQDPSMDPKAAIMVLVVTPKTIQDNEAGSYQIIDHPELPGHRAVSGPHVKFDKLRVPARNLFAGPGHGANLVGTAVASSAVLVGAMSVGIMRATFDAVLKYAKQESRGGSTPIIGKQSVADILIDIKVKCDASRTLNWAASHALMNGFGLELALEAKIFCSDNAVQCAVSAMNAVGVSSYNMATPFPRLLNDALCLPLFSGGNIGVRRRQLEKIFAAEDYKSWSTL